MNYRTRHVVTGLVFGLIVCSVLLLNMSDDRFAADRLSGKVRVLCWIMTGPQNLNKKAVHVRNTWGKRCNVLLFMSSVTNKTFPAIGLNTTEGREHLLAKTVLAFRYIYRHYFDAADWFLKADDDTYVIMENLRHFLYRENSETPIFFGRRFKVPTSKQEYFTGGAGYVLSKAALRKFAEKGNNSKICLQDGEMEDIRFSKCLQNLGIKSGNSTDPCGRNRFHHLSFEAHIMRQYPYWYNDRHFETPKRGVESISKYAISFHKVSPEKMYVMEFFLYHLQVFGRRPGVPS